MSRRKRSPYRFELLEARQLMAADDSNLFDSEGAVDLEGPVDSEGTVESSTTDDWAARCLAPVKDQGLSIRSIESTGPFVGPKRDPSNTLPDVSPLNSDPTISIADASVTEGNSGPITLEFDVELSVAATETVRIDVEVVAQSAQRLVTERLTSGLNEPVFVTAAPGDTQNLFVVEQDGWIKRIDRESGVVAGTSFLRVSDVSTGGERGLLGLAFHPRYESNRYFFIYMTDSRGDTLIRRYTANANGLTADATSAVTVLGFDQPFGNHNAGWMDFGPDGFLYVASGDGGSGNDPQNNAQDITNNLLGKMLRLDVDQDDFPSDPNRNYGVPATNPFVGTVGDDEIWAYGLRNPWRNSFDRETGDLLIADVGQSELEEINLQPSTSPGGENYGWRLREGTIATPNVGGPRPAGAIDPIYEYSHGVRSDQGFSVTGGYVYRGPIRELQGQYFFADFVTERIWSIRPNEDIPAEFDGTNFTDFTDWTSLLRPDIGQIADISSFGEDNDGNLYIVDRQGEVFRITEGADYQVSNASITIDIGETLGTFQVDVLGDRLPETNETLTVNLTGSVGAVISDGTAIGTILNDDAPTVKTVSFGAESLGRSQVTEIVVGFDSEVSVDAMTNLAFQLSNQATDASVALDPDISIVDGETLATLRFEPGASTQVGVNGTVMLVDGFYELSILSSGIQIGGVGLDGDDDGVAGGDRVLGRTRADEFFRLFGDRDGDSDVDANDFLFFQSVFATQADDERFDAAFDHNDDGRIDSIDLAEFRQRLGRSI